MDKEEERRSDNSVYVVSSENVTCEVVSHGLC